MIPRSPARIELSRAALARNVRAVTRIVSKRTRISAVVKGNAYGHGIEPFVPMVEANGVHNFSVFSADEAYRVLGARQSPRTEVMVMGMIADDELEWAVEHGVSFWVFDTRRLRGAVEAARRVGRPARVHLELETGFHRTGLEAEDLDELVETVHAAGGDLLVEGICTHYAGAESVANYVRVQDQQECFQQRVRWLEERGVRPAYLHTSSSAAAVLYPHLQHDLIRVGILLYGFWPSEETKMHVLLSPGRRSVNDPLKRVLRWSSRVMSVKEVPAGRFVNYGTSYLTSRRQRIAAIPVGYAHGFARSLSNTGQVLVRGRRCQVAGMVNMNEVLVDVTDADGVEVGDEVVLIGRQGRQEIGVSAFSQFAGAMNYELLSRLPTTLERVAVD